MAATRQELQELDELQAFYQAAVEDWIVAIRKEQALATGPHSVAEIDKWEAAHFREDEKRKEVADRKKLYEEALRREFFGF
jgi:hypothetical protein